MHGRKKDTVYYGVNVTALCLAAVFFARDYQDAGGLFRQEHTVSILLLLVAAMTVHSIKAVRLYFALYGNAVGRKRYLKVYCKVTPVSMVIPFKMGEFFRMYCYGKEMGSFLKGIVIILLDRFMDTAALLAIFFSTWALSDGGRVSRLAVLLTQLSHKDFLRKFL